MSKATGKNTASKFRVVGSNTAPIKFDTEGHDAHGREIVLSRPEAPTRVDEVNDSLYYLGWAEYASLDDEPVWKIKRVQKIGNTWELKFAYGEQFYRHKWSDRSILPYA